MVDVGCWMVGVRVWGLCKAGRCWGLFVYKRLCRLPREVPIRSVLSNQLCSIEYIEASLYGAGWWFLGELAVVVIDTMLRRRRFVRVWGRSLTINFLL
jgi:hypothetical protein